MAIYNQEIEKKFSFYNLKSIEKNLKQTKSGKALFVCFKLNEGLQDCYIWGVSGEKENEHLVNEMEKGDIVLFGLENKIKYVGEVYTTSLKLDMDLELIKSISEELWKNNNYEILYFMKSLMPVSGEMSSFNNFFGYNQSAMFRGISKVKTSTIKNVDDGKETLFKMLAREIIKSEKQ